MKLREFYWSDNRVYQLRDSQWFYYIRGYTGIVAGADLMDSPINEYKDKAVTFLYAKLRGWPG